MGLGSLFKAVVKIAISPITVPVAIIKDTTNSMTGGNSGLRNTKGVMESIAEDLDDVTK